MSRSDVQLRARHAEDFLETATDALALHPDRTDVAASEGADVSVGGWFGWEE